MLTFGEADILRIEEQTQTVPLALLNAPAALVAANDGLRPDFVGRGPDGEDTFQLVFQTWIARIGGRNIVIDPCVGNGRELPVLPQFHRLDTPYIERFEASGVRPEQVDIVFCTHMHCDYCGWNTRLRDGRWVPTFPNARYLFVRREAERWGGRRGEYPDIEYNSGVYEASVRPVIDAGLAELIADHHRIDPRLAIEPAYGHTAGHSILRMATGAEEVLFTGDAFHHPLQVPDPAIDLGGVDDLPAAIATRHRLRADIAERRAVFFPAHFPAPHGGRIRREGAGFAFVPLAP